MPVYTTDIAVHSSFGVCLRTGGNTTTYIQLPTTDSHVTQVAATPVWSPVLYSSITTVANNASATITTLPREEHGGKYTIRALSGRARVVFNGDASHYLLLDEYMVWERVIPKSLIANITITGLADGTSVYVCVEDNMTPGN